MGYKFRNGDTPDHVDSSMSNPTLPQVSSDSTKRNPDAAVKSAFRDAQAKGDTAQMRRITDRVSTPKSGTPNKDVMQQGKPKYIKTMSSDDGFDQYPDSVRADSPEGKFLSKNRKKP